MCVCTHSCQHWFGEILFQDKRTRSTDITQSKPPSLRY